MCGAMPKSTREEQISQAVERIERSPLSAEAYLRRYGAPFSIAQFYRYRATLSTQGKPGLRDRRQDGNHRRLGPDEMTFIRGFVKDRAEVSPSQVQRAVSEECGVGVHRSTMSRVLNKLGVVCARRGREVVKRERVSCAGFELIAALAVQLGWPEHTARCLREAIECRGAEPQPSGRADTYGRNAKGQFTKRYNRRASVRKTRFASIELKRSKKDLRGMDIFEASMKTLERKALAVLALPLVTSNGQVRHVNTARGNALEGLCGYNYKQSTLDGFLRELKYLGASQWLLGGQVGFWHERWSEAESGVELPFL